MHGIKRRLSDYVLFFYSHPSVSARSQRQLAGAVGIGIGVLALYDDESLKSTVWEMESRQNILMRQMSGLTYDTLALEKKLFEAQGSFGNDAVF